MYPFCGNMKKNASYSLSTVILYFLTMTIPQCYVALLHKNRASINIRGFVRHILDAELRQT